MQDFSFFFINIWVYVLILRKAYHIDNEDRKTSCSKANMYCDLKFLRKVFHVDNEDWKTSCLSCSNANTYCDLKFVQIINATYHKSHKNEHSYSYDFSAVRSFVNSFFSSKHGKLLALFCLNLGFKLKIIPAINLWCWAELCMDLWLHLL